MANRRLAVAQRSSPDALISLYDVDLSKYGGGTLYWTPGQMAHPGSNLIWNSCLPRATTGWVTGGTAPPPAFSVASSGTGSYYQRRLQEWGCGYAEWANTLTGSAWGDIAWGGGGTAAGLVVSPGQWLDAQIRVLPIRCSVELVIAFYNGNTFVSQAVSAPVVETGDRGGGAGVSDYDLLTVQAQALPGVTHATLLIRVRPAPGNPTANIVFFSQAQLAMPAGKPDAALAWSPGVKAGAVRFGGIAYQAVPIELEEIETSSSGPIARPKVMLNDIGGFATNLMLAYGGLLGCKVTRRQAFTRFLDGGHEADPSDFFGPDVFYIDRVAEHRPGEYLTLECCSPLDIQGAKIPGRQVIRDTCTHTYRTYNASTGQFTQGSCPYAAASYYKADGTVTGAPAQDSCGRRLTDCILRFPNQPLKTRAFPGVIRMR